MLSLFMSVGVILSALSSTAIATTYKLVDSYAGSTFLNGFDFFTAADPTNGFVQYLDQTTASDANIVKMIGTDNYIGVDYTTSLTVAGGAGRGSVRIESKKTYNKGLFIVDVKHMPGGICGTWPAFWSLGSGTWPQGGEIDIIEGVNQNTQNKMVLHTDTNCSTNGVGQTGAQSLYNCALDSASGSSGCDVNAAEANTFGAGFNSASGGVYAMERTSTSIKVWFFPRGSIPASITAEAPDTATFGTPNSNFEGACDMDMRFKDHKFIFDNTFCGDWAGNVYGDSTCTKYTGLSGMDSCKKFVAENPAAFKDAFWQITYFKTYVLTSGISSSSSVRPSSTSSIRTTLTSTSTSTTRPATTSTSRSSTRSASISTSTRLSSALSTTTRASTLVTSTRTSTASTSTVTKKVSTDATCGGTFGFTCQGSTFGNCCSSSGWCGSTTAYCSTGCQSGFGTCSSVVASSSVVVSASSKRTSTSAAATATKKVTTDATCGNTGGLTCLGSTFGNCCSSSGWCGSTTAYCGTGCQAGFGTCT